MSRSPAVAHLSLSLPHRVGRSILDWYVALLTCALALLAPGCHMIVPKVSHYPQVHNPFPQLSRVAVAPFFNQSDEPTLDGRRFSLAYFQQLQAVPGFEVVPLGVVEEAIIRHAVDLSGPGEARRLARILGVDAVVVGSVTDYSPYQPPRCGLRVEWYTANPGYHEIPAGYGLPWGTPEEEFIPPSLVYEAEMARARAQLAAQAPDCTHLQNPLPPPQVEASGPTLRQPQLPLEPVELPVDTEQLTDPFEDEPEPLPPPPGANSEPATTAPSAETKEVTVGFDEQVLPLGEGAPAELPPVGPKPSGSDVTEPTTAPSGRVGATGANGAIWSYDLGFDPSSSCGVRPPCILNDGPVMTHTRIYHAEDPEFLEALENYVYFRHDESYSGGHTYLQRSGDFIRFCCHLHIFEMLSARGGAGETRVVCEWPADR